MAKTSRPARPRLRLRAVPPPDRSHDHRVPGIFQPDRDRAPGRYPLLEVFRGLDRTVPFRKYPGDDAAIRRTVRSAYAQVEDGPGWIYVAPRKTPEEIRAAGFEMVRSPDEVIVIARTHLVEGSKMDLYLDVIHEFLHVLQRQQRRELWPGLKVPYVDRPTEIEAYAFSVVEARRLGVPDSYLRDYLQGAWFGRAEYRRLLRNVGVRPVPRGGRPDAAVA